MLATILPAHGSKTLLLPVQPCPEAHPVTAVHPQGAVSRRRDLFAVPQSLADALAFRQPALSLISCLSGYRLSLADPPAF